MRAWPSILGVFALSACGPDQAALCEHLAALEEAERGHVPAGFDRRCAKEVKNRRLEAGALRWPGVARCVAAAADKQAVEACWVGRPEED